MVHIYRVFITDVASIRSMRLTTQWRAAFRVKSFKAAVIRRKWLEEGAKGEG